MPDAPGVGEIYNGGTVEEVKYGSSEVTVKFQKGWLGRIVEASPGSILAEIPTLCALGYEISSGQTENAVALGIVAALLAAKIAISGARNPGTFRVTYDLVDSKPSNSWIHRFNSRWNESHPDDRFTPKPDHKNP